MVDGKIHEIANVTVRKNIFPYIQDGEIKDSIRYDELLLLYANNQSDKYSHENYSMIRSKLRLLGRFLLTAKGLCNEIIDFASLYRPKYFKFSLRAAGIVAGYDVQKGTFSSPTNILTIGTALKQIGKFLETLYIEREDKEKQKMTKDFVKLVTQGFQSINRKATEAQVKRNRLKEVYLPSTDDVIKLNEYLTDKRIETYNKLKKSYSYECWISLSEISLIELQLFNRRRQGINGDTNSVEYQTLSRKCKEATNAYQRFTIRGKLGRTVSVLVHKDIQDSINLILEYRKKAGVSPINEYLFALLSLDENRQHRHLIACDVLRKFSELCGAKSPKSLRGTTLRKQIATMCASLGLNEQEVGDLANYLGHAINIHKQFYRQPLVVREICQMSQILQTATPTSKKLIQNVSEEIIEDKGQTSTPESFDDTLSSSVCNVTKDSEVIDEPEIYKKVRQKSTRKRFHKDKKSEYDMQRKKRKLRTQKSKRDQALKDVIESGSEYCMSEDHDTDESDEQVKKSVLKTKRKNVDSLL
ncbi:uncharacterized protein [Prorops nasuta]|uniref:uncharacterized protein n=1 Tax=Prorops nasuta TaxID=863751 RepID=UPI0034CD07C4